MTLFDIMRLIKCGGGGSISLQTKAASPAKASQSITADEGYDGLSAVTVDAIPDLYRRMPTLSSPTRTAQWFDGVTIGSTQAIRLIGDPPIVGETITVQPTITNYTQAGEPAKACITGTVTSVETSESSVLVNVRVTDKYIDYIPAGTINIDTNGTYNVKDCETADVSIPGPESVLTDPVYDPDAPVALTVPGLVNVRPYAFYVQASIQSLDLPDANRLGVNACADMTTLHSVSLPVATYIGPRAFYGDDLVDIKAPSVTLISKETFACCAQLEKLSLPSLTEIGQPTQTFAYCSHLKKLRLPKFQQLRAAASNLFAGTTALESVDSGVATAIQSTTTLSGLNVSTALKLVALHCDTQVVVLSAAFNANAPITRGTGFVLVPRQYLTQYQTATNWSTLYNAGTQFLAIEDYTVDGTASGELDEDKIDALLA